MNENTYPNIQTWMVKSHLENDNNLRGQCLMLVDQLKRLNKPKEECVSVISDSLKKFYKECMPPKQGLWTSFIEYCFRLIEWERIASDIFEQRS